LGKTNKNRRNFLGLPSATITYMSIVSNCTESAIMAAAKSLINGNLVSFATETVYGLGADATNKDAVSKIYEVKGRPTIHPLIVHISSLELLGNWARDIPEYATTLAKSFWPGPMTLILPRTKLAKNFITAGQDNVGIRVPSHTIALALLREFESQGGLGIAAPSANRFGKVSPTSAQAVSDELSNYLSTEDLILDGGPCAVGVESTIIDCTRRMPVILRPGEVSSEMIEELLSIKLPISNTQSNQIKAPGLLTYHYSPDAKLFLTGTPAPGDGLIAPIGINTPDGVIRLASPKNNADYARTLYSSLRQGDALGIKNIFAVPAEDFGVGVAINDRLKKAANKLN
jgi:L-threonylcarbamoyladenylate synthase